MVEAFNLKILQKDIVTLRGSNWLNDEVSIPFVKANRGYNRSSIFTWNLSLNALNKRQNCRNASVSILFSILPWSRTIAVFVDGRNEETSTFLQWIKFLFLFTKETIGAWPLLTSETKRLNIMTLLQEVPAKLYR